MTSQYSFSLQRFLQPAPKPATGEVCELCGAPIEPEHGHIADLQLRTILCGCRGCCLLFDAEGSGGRRFRAIPQRYLAVSDTALARQIWEQLQVPVGLVFVFVNSSLGKATAFYPSPGGAVESEIALETWQHLAEASPALQSMLPDLEAALVRVQDDEVTCHVLPIDVCYELVGRLRMSWRGFSGGADAHAVLDGFFKRVAAQVEKSPA